MKAGDKAIFHSTAQTKGYPAYPERSGETVEIFRAVTAAEADLDEVGPMFVIRFPDGADTWAYLHELKRMT